MSDSCWHWCCRSAACGSHFPSHGRQEERHKLVIFSCYFSPAAEGSSLLKSQRHLRALGTAVLCASASSPPLPSIGWGGRPRWGWPGQSGEAGGQLMEKTVLLCLDPAVFSFPLLLSGIEHQQNRKPLPPAADPAIPGQLPAAQSGLPTPTCS